MSFVRCRCGEFYIEETSELGLCSKCTENLPISDPLSKLSNKLNTLEILLLRCKDVLNNSKVSDNLNYERLILIKEIEEFNSNDVEV